MSASTVRARSASCAAARSFRSTEGGRRPVQWGGLLLVAFLDRTRKATGTRGRPPKQLRAAQTGKKWALPFSRGEKGKRWGAEGCAVGPLPRGRRGKGGASFGKECYPASTSSTSSTQCRTGMGVALRRWSRQPMLAVAITSGPPDSRASALLCARRREISGCNRE